MPGTHGWAELTQPRICKTGFREYDARWQFPEQITLEGFHRVGSALGALIHEIGAEPRIVAGHDFRAYSPSVANSLMLGLAGAGIQVLDIGMVVSPAAYFARVALEVPSVAMVTASHNPNGWTGLKAGFRHPLTMSEGEISRLQELALGEGDLQKPGGSIQRMEGIGDRWLDAICGSFRMRRPLKAVCATGNGTASLFAPRALERIGIEVVPRHCTPDYSFPNYDPNPESLLMLDDMAVAVKSAEADLAFGFDGDGDRLGVVDETGKPLFSDKLGVLLARDIARSHPGARFIADVKSTSLFQTDPELGMHGASTEYWRTGHGHIKARMHDTGALAAFEKSGHFYFGPPVGGGYDDAILAAVRLCKMLDAAPSMSMAELSDTLAPTWSTPTMSPHCEDERKYQAVEQITRRLFALKESSAPFASLKITGINTINGARCSLSNGSWFLVRASSNTPNLVVVCESVDSEQEMRRIFEALDEIISNTSGVGPYDQRI